MISKYGFGFEQKPREVYFFLPLAKAIYSKQTNGSPNMPMT